MFKIQKLDFLISLYIVCIAISELIGGKTFALPQIGPFHFNASVAVFLIPFIYTVNDVFVEVLGLERARSIVRSGIITVFFILVYSVIAVSLPPSTRFAPTEKAYDTIFSVSARIAAASLTAFAFAELLDVFIFAKMRKAFGQKRLWLRNNVSNIVSEFIDTITFMTIAFYAFDKPFANNVTFLWSIILPYWFLKCIMSVIETPFVYLGVAWLKDEKK